MNSRMMALELIAIRRRIDRCLESETASRQTALEDVDGMLAKLLMAVTAAAR